MNSLHSIEHATIDLWLGDTYWAHRWMPIGNGTYVARCDQKHWERRGDAPTYGYDLQRLHDEGWTNPDGNRHPECEE